MKDISALHMFKENILQIKWYKDSVDLWKFWFFDSNLREFILLQLKLFFHEHLIAIVHIHYNTPLFHPVLGPRS